MNSENNSSVDVVDNQTKWERHENGNIPCNAVYAGLNCYAVRAMHEGSRLVGSLIKGEQYAYVIYCGKIFKKYEYQVLVESEIVDTSKLVWRYTDGKSLPEGAIMGGHDGSTMLFIGRTVFFGMILVGSYRMDDRKLYVAYKDEFLPFDNCDILCKVDR